MPRFLAQVREVLDPARVPKIHAETAAKQNAGLNSMLDGEIAAQIATLARRRAGTPAAPACAKARSAVSQHQIWLEKRLLPEAKGDFRLGAELYDQKLAFALFSPLTRQEIRERAESELAATRAAMYEIARRVLKGKRGSAADAGESQRRAAAAGDQGRARARLRGTPGARRVLDAARASLVDATQFVREKNIVTVPDEPLEIIVMPEFQQGVALAYCDSPGPLEEGQKTFYAVRRSRRLDARADRLVPARIQHALDPRPHHPRGDAGPLPAARARQQVSVDAARGAGLGPVHRRLGGVRGTRDDRRRAT